MNLLKSHFFDDRKNRLHDEEIKLSNKRYGSYGDSSHPHDTKNLISGSRTAPDSRQSWGATDAEDLHSRICAGRFRVALWQPQGYLKVNLGYP